MTSLDDYKNNLKKIIIDYNLGNKTVVEFGVEEGISTRVFLEGGCELTCVDWHIPTWLRSSPAHYYEMDARKAIDKLVNNETKFDAIYWDITFYEDIAKSPYGSKVAYKHEYSELSKYLPKLYHDLLRKKGILMVNDFINDVGKRRAVRDAVVNFSSDNSLLFKVYYSRGGIAVFEK